MRALGPRARTAEIAKRNRYVLAMRLLVFFALAGCASNSTPLDGGVQPGADGNVGDSPTVDSTKVDSPTVDSTKVDSPTSDGTAMDTGTTDAGCGTIGSLDKGCSTYGTCLKGNTLVCDDNCMADGGLQALCHSSALCSGPGVGFCCLWVTGTVKPGCPIVVSVPLGTHPATTCYARAVGAAAPEPCTSATICESNADCPSGQTCTPARFNSTTGPLLGICQ
jgi:hypothetical protein